MIFQTMFMYLIISSACLLYGIGIKDLMESPDNISGIITAYLKTLVSVIVSLLLMWVLLRFVLVPYNFQLVFPLVLLIILVLMSVVLEKVWPSFLKPSTREFTLAFFAIFLALGEGSSLLNSLIIGFTTVNAFYLLVFLLYCINRKNTSVVISPHFNTVALMLITFACVILALYGWNVSWLNEKFFY